MAPAQGRALVSRRSLHQGGWKIEDVVTRALGPEELLIQMVASGVCHTDVDVGTNPAKTTKRGSYPRVLGHEGTRVTCVSNSVVFESSSTLTVD